ncbi:MAG TPA: response regulator, partial [Candidatus Eisenbacteria bacterium]
MEQKRVLIVEPDNAFALSLAAIFREDGAATRVASSAAEAELEIATRRPDLSVIRAELSDLSGFSLCARLRHDPATSTLKIILYSSDTPPEALAEHARTAWAANGYLAMPLDMDALRKLAASLLAREEAVESADDAVILEDVEEVAAAGAPGGPGDAAQPGEAPPPV